MAVRHRLHPRSRDIIVQRRERAGVGEGAEARAQQRMIAREGELGLPDRGAAGELGGILQHARDRVGIGGGEGGDQDDDEQNRDRDDGAVEAARQAMR